MTRVALLRACCTFLVAAMAVPGCSPDDEPVAEPVTDTDRYLGSEACAECHEPAFTAWRGSHHELAMQKADEDTVLADFDDVSFEYFGTTAEFLRDGAEFVVRTESESMGIAEYTVSHTFGVYPLQQYLVEFADGRLQALPFLWDTRAEDEGGQRWYHLYEDEFVGPDDPLHWTGRYFNWNVMCAECHSTNVRLGYDIESDTFDTHWDEISVGCEACHGPGSKHVAQAQRSTFDAEFGLALNLDDAGETAWVMNTETGIAELSTPRMPQQQPESCGRCHARRSVLTEDYEYGRPLADTHVPSLLEEHLYFADGRIQGEVYVYGSFLQSAMYRAGVTCTDCHDPHTAQLVTGPNPNDVCSQCHLPSIFATRDHNGADSVACVDCHMQARTYMGVDDRRDHSFRLPESPPYHYEEWIAAARDGSGDNGDLTFALGLDFPAIVNATLLSHIEAPIHPYDMSAVHAMFSSPEPLERIGALRAVRTMPPEERLRWGTELLRDEIRGVRVEAAMTFADVNDLLPIEDARSFSVAADEYRESLMLTANMPEGATLLAEFEFRLGDVPTSGTWLDHALRLDPDFAPAVHARGLHRIRSGLPDLAVEDFRRAADLEPEISRYAYVLGVAMNSTGRPEEALEVLYDARAAFPEDFEIGWGLATMLRDAGRLDEAREIVGEMLQLYPDDPNLNVLMRSLSQRP